MVQISQLFSRCTDRKSFVHLNTHVLLCQLNLINMTSFSITPLCFVSLNLDTNETWLNSVNFGNNADFLQNGWNRVNLGEKVRYLVNLKTQNAWLNLIKCSKTGENPAMTSSQLAIKGKPNEITSSFTVYHSNCWAHQRCSWWLFKNACWS